MWLAKRLKSRPSFQIAVVNTDRKPLREFKRRWGGQIHPLIDARPHIKPRIVWRWCVGGKPARVAIRAMQRHMVVKAPQAVLWLRAWDEITSRPRGDRRIARERWYSASLSRLKRI